MGYKTKREIEESERKISAEDRFKSILADSGLSEDVVKKTSAELGLVCKEMCSKLDTDLTNLEMGRSFGSESEKERNALSFGKDRDRLIQDAKKDSIRKAREIVSSLTVVSDGIDGILQRAADRTADASVRRFML